VRQHQLDSPPSSLSPSAFDKNKEVDLSFIPLHRPDVAYSNQNRGSSLILRNNAYFFPFLNRAITNLTRKHIYVDMVNLLSKTIRMVLPSTNFRFPETVFEHWLMRMRLGALINSSILSNDKIIRTFFNPQLKEKLV
jgi:hypothetical protein